MTARLQFYLPILLVSSVLSLTHTEAQASGCGSYDNSRTVIQNDLVSDWPQDEFTVLSRTADTITVKMKATGQDIVLGWEKSEKYEDRYNRERFEKRDLLFEEGNGCGPIYRCVTGQVRITLFDAKTGRSEAYSFPLVNDMYTSHEMRYASDSLLPVWGSLKLDVKSLAEYGGRETYPIDKTQCGYGVW